MILYAAKQFFFPQCLRFFRGRKGFGRGVSLRAVPDKKDVFTEIVSGDPGKRSYKKAAGFHSQ